jgi:hypothetical protein
MSADKFLQQKTIAIMKYEEQKAQLERASTQTIKEDE